MIGQLSKVRPELGNFAICPYASKANFAIIDEKLAQIMPDPNYMHIYVVDILVKIFYMMLLMTIIVTILTLNSLQITKKKNLHTRSSNK